MKNNRKEIDTLGEYQVPHNALYGSQTKRSYDTLKITNRPFSHEIILNMIKIKMIEAKLNKKNQRLPLDKADNIIWACQELISNFANYQAHFITDEIQGGAGTSVNMNVNEVIANMASKKIGKIYGNYYVHPNNDVNLGQSTNDIFPTAGKITFINFIDKLILKIKLLQRELNKLSQKFKNIIRVGKTHLQDAVPMKFDSLFISWSKSLERDIKRFKDTRKNLLEINIGGTAIGTGISQTKFNIDELFVEMSNTFQLKFKKPQSFIDISRNVDVLTQLSDVIKNFVINLSKNCNDIRLLSSGSSSGFRELILEEIQPGSSIMPGKINPVIYESINQIAFAIIGRNASIAFAAEAGQMELNVFEPIIFTSLIESLKWSIRSCELLIEKGVKVVKPNIEGIKNNINNSSFIATLFINKYGYDRISKIIYQSHKMGSSIKKELQSALELSDQEYDEFTSSKLLFPLEESDE